MYEKAALKINAVIGIIAFLFLFGVAFTLRKAQEPRDAQRVNLSRDLKYSTFNSERAYSDLDKIVGFGPRPAGSEGAEKMRTYLRAELAKTGLRVREQAFEAETPAGKRAMVNLTAIIPGTRSGVILLSNHYDTKYFTDFTFVGANDGGSTTAWMLEMARALAADERDGRSIWLTWFDGEEAFGEWSATDSLYGSRAFVEDLRKKGELEKIALQINVDMIGDCYLRIMRDSGAPEAIAQVLWDTAERLGYGMHFSDFGEGTEDDHIPFRAAGVPAINLIDFSYGGSMAQHRLNWHTAEDTLEKVCPGSLQAVADVIYHALPALDAALDRAGTP